MSWLSSAIGGIAGLLGQSSANSAQAALQASSEAFQREVLQNRYQWTVQDLRSAGLNPILAVSGGLGSSGAAAPSAPQVGNVGAAAVNGAVAMKQLAQADEVNQSVIAKNNASAQESEAKADYQNLAIRSGLPIAQASNSLASARAYDSQVALNTQRVNESRATVNEITSRVQKTQTEINKLTAEISLLRSRERTEDVNRALKTAEVSLARARTDFNRLQGLQSKASVVYSTALSEKIRLENEWYSGEIGTLRRYAPYVGDIVASGIMGIDNSVQIKDKLKKKFGW